MASGGDFTPWPEEPQPRQEIRPHPSPSPRKPKLGTEAASALGCTLLRWVRRTHPPPLCVLDSGDIPLQQGGGARVRKALCSAAFASLTGPYSPQGAGHRNKDAARPAELAT